MLGHWKNPDREVRKLIRALDATLPRKPLHSLNKCRVLLLAHAAPVRLAANARADGEYGALLLTLRLRRASGRVECRPLGAPPLLLPQQLAQLPTLAPSKLAARGALQLDARRRDFAQPQH